LSDRVAAILAGLVACWFFLWLMIELRRRYFPDLPASFVGWFLFAFALGTPLALTVFRGTVYNESIGIAVASILGSFCAWLAYSREPSLKWAVLCGLGVGFAVATRVTLAMYGLAFFFGLAALERLRPKPDWSGAIARLGVYCLPISAVRILADGLQRGALQRAVRLRQPLQARAHAWLSAAAGGAHSRIDPALLSSRRFDFPATSPTWSTRVGSRWSTCAAPKRLRRCCWLLRGCC
jgi:hypothetical protein